MDPIQSLLQSLQGPDGEPLRHALRRLLEEEPVQAGNGTRTVSLLGDESRVPSVAVSLPTGDRYEIGEVLGTGANGAVYDAFDRQLHRRVALKALSPDRTGSPQAWRSFLREARITGSLQHPGIVAVHDVGLLPDGRPFYVMRQVQGRSLRAHIEQPAPHASPLNDLRQHVGVLIQAADAMSYAHAQGVVHRDIKPGNIVVGPYGEVAVIDWGLARVLGESEHSEATGGLEIPADGYQTMTGQLAGSPAYMSPEQACGEPATRAVDIYGIGASLYHVLSGRSPFHGLSSGDILLRLRRGDVPAPPRGSPTILAELCRWAMQPHPGARPADCATLAHRLRDWYDGRETAELAIREVDLAHRVLIKVDGLRRQSQAVESQLADAEDSWGLREERWALEDRLKSLQGSADLLQASAVNHAQAALAHDAENKAARRLLADHYASVHRRAERAGKRSEAAQAEVFLRSYDDGHHAGYLKGEGQLNLRVPGATRVRLERAVQHARLLRTEPVGQWTGSVSGMSLPIGSYVASLTHESVTIRLPFLIRREVPWTQVPPRETREREVRIPRDGDLDETEVFVPAGWYQAGGDDRATDSESQNWRWVGDFVMRRHPVTNAEYRAFLQDLLVQGLEDRALQYAPLPRCSGDSSWVIGGPGSRQHVLVDERVRDDSPVVNVTYEAATAFALWVSENTGHWWRLPSEDEWEKAARGVDLRPFPMGMDGQAVALNIGSADGDLISVFDHTMDESVYGVYGLAGNARTWCRPCRVRDDGKFPVRGGGYATDESRCRSAARTRLPAQSVRMDLGIRLVRPLRRQS